MRYVVLCHTNTIDTSSRHEDKWSDVITTHVMLNCVNRADAEHVARLMNNGNCQTLRDPPFKITRAYEVGAILFTSKGKVTLTLSDLEMIANEYTMPAGVALAAAALAAE